MNIRWLSYKSMISKILKTFEHRTVSEKSAPVQLLLLLELGWGIPQRASSSLSVGSWRGFAWLSWPIETGSRSTAGSDWKEGSFIEKSR